MAGFSYLVLLGDFMKQVIHFANSIMGDVHAVPAYGRDYKSAAAVKADWHAGKDFVDSAINQYFSIRDRVPCEVWVRYGKTQISRQGIYIYGKLVRVQ